MFSQRDLFHISPQKPMPILVFSKHSIRYVLYPVLMSSALEDVRFVFPWNSNVVGQKKNILVIWLLPVN